MQASVYHDIRTGNRIFLCIAAKSNCSVERELLPEQATKDGVLGLIAEMEKESGMKLEISAILKSELGL